MHVYGIDRYVSICRSASVIAVPSFPACCRLRRESAKTVSVEPIPITSTVKAINSSISPCPASERSRGFRRRSRHEQPETAGHSRHVAGATANDGVLVVVVTPRRRSGGVFVTWNWPFPITDP